MRLYKYIQKDIQQEDLQYQDLVELNISNEFPAKKSIIRNYLSAMDFYTPTDGDFTCRYRILTKIINKYYNYELFTDNYEYFGNRMLWRLNKIMPTYRAKFNSLLAQNGYEDIWEDGLLWEHREGTRDTKRPEKDNDNHPVNFDRTDLADTTTTVGYNSDYPQVIVGSSTDYNATGDKTTTGRTGNDTVTHAMQENVGYGEDITRKFSPEEIAKAKLLFAQLIFNIDEEIVNAVADLFVLVDYPFEDDFDVGIQMSILDDAKAYTNLKFNESKAYTDQEVAKAKEIVYIPYSGTYADIFTALSNNKLPIYIPQGTVEPKYYYYQEQDLDGKYTFTNGLDWAKCDSNSSWSFGVLARPELFKCTYNQTTFAEITQALNDGKIPYCVFTTGEYFYYYLNIDNTKYRFTESYIRETGVTYFIDVDNTNQWGIVPVTVEMVSNKTVSISSSSTDAQYPSAKATYDYVYGVEQSIYQAIGNSYQTLGNLVTSWGNPTSDSKYPSEKLVKDTIDGMAVFYDIDDVAWNDIASAKNNGKTIYLYTELGTGIKLYWYLDAYLPNTNNDGMARFVQIGGNQQFDIDYQDNQSTSDTLDVHDLFECTYGTTTYAQITTALSGGKIPYCNYNGNLYFYAFATSTQYFFTSFPSKDSAVRLLEVYVNTSNTWAIASTDFQLSRLVTSWQATPDNTHYPSEKLVKDSIDAIPKLYECTYGTTTYTEVDQALSDGKLPILYYNSNLYILTSKTATVFTFGRVRGSTQLATITLTSPTTWSAENSLVLQRTSYLDNSVTNPISASSSDTHYPSSKNVYNAIQSVVGSGVTSYLLDLDTYAYESNVYTITGIDLTNATKITLLPDATQDTRWFYASLPASMPYITAITASGFQITDIGNTPAGRKLILTVYS